MAPEGRGIIMHMMFSGLLAIAMAGTFFGKSIIGITLGVVVLISFGVVAWQRKQIFKKDSLKAFIHAKETGAIMLLWLAWLLSSLYANNTEEALENWAEMVGLMVGGTVIFAALCATDFDFRRMMIITVSIAMVCAGLMVIAPWVRGMVDIEWSTSYGSVLAVIVPFAAMLAYADDGKKTIIWWLALFILSAGIFASGGRTAWFALAAVIVLFPFLFPWQGIGRPVFKSVVALILIGSGIMMGLTSYKAYVGEQLYASRTRAMTNLERPASGRLTAWENSLPHIQDNLWLGVGMKGTHALQIEKAEGAYVVHMHNVVLEFLLETGVIGLLAFTAVITVFSLSFIKAYRASDNRVAKRNGATIFMACIAYGVASMALTSMFHAWWFLYLVVLLIMLKLSERQLNPE